MPYRPSRPFTAMVIGMLLTALAVIPGLSSLVLFPGVLLTLPFWPQGIHTRSGDASGLGFLAVLIGGSWLVWSVLALAVLRLRQKEMT